MFTPEMLMERIETLQYDGYLAERAAEIVAREIQPYVTKIWPRLGPAFVLSLYQRNLAVQRECGHRSNNAPDADSGSADAHTFGVRRERKSHGEPDDQCSSARAVRVRPEKVAAVATRPAPSLQSTDTQSSAARAPAVAKQQHGTPWYARINWDAEIRIGGINKPLRDVTRADLRAAHNALIEKSNILQAAARNIRFLIAELKDDSETLHQAAKRLGDRFPLSSVRRLLPTSER